MKVLIQDSNMYFQEMVDLVKKFLKETVNLETWNQVQKDLWLELVQDRLVKKNDYKLFFRFGKLFHQFFVKNKRFPSEQEMQGLLNV